MRPCPKWLWPGHYTSPYYLSQQPHIAGPNGAAPPVRPVDQPSWLHAPMLQTAQPRSRMWTPMLDRHVAQVLDSNRPCQRSCFASSCTGRHCSKAGPPPSVWQALNPVTQEPVLDSITPIHTAHLFSLQQRLVVGAALVVCPVADNRGQAMQKHQLRHLQQQHKSH